MFLLAFCVGPPWYYVDKYAPAAVTGRPTAFPALLVPERQVEPHTCGLHTLSSIYRAYGLDAEAQDLRFRLGTDKPFSNFLADSAGTIHPDMLRVLHQDGFQTELLFPGASETPARLSEHLQRGHVAAALTKVSEFHWVGLSRAADGRLRVCDSLVERPYERDQADYLRAGVYSLILISPQSP
ncbi:MAG: hypothetical protein ACF8R7_18805 [Phycisphaerales bacterium JB039]